MAASVGNRMVDAWKTPGFTTPCWRSGSRPAVVTRVASFIRGLLAVPNGRGLG
jgi:hypothetical protein